MNISYRKRLRTFENNISIYINNFLVTSCVLYEFIIRLVCTKKVIILLSVLRSYTVYCISGKKAIFFFAMRKSIINISCFTIIELSSGRKRLNRIVIIHTESSPRSIFVCLKHSIKFPSYFFVLFDWIYNRRCSFSKH